MATSNASVIRIVGADGKIVVRRGVVRTRKDKMSGSFARVSIGGKKVMVHRGYGKRLFTLNKPPVAEKPRTHQLSVRTLAKIRKARQKATAS